MTWWQAIVLGIVEGLTEYLPVSSTGHLILAQRLMGIGDDSAAGAYAICIQAGAILAVLELYFRRVKQMSVGLLGKDPQGLRLSVNVIMGFLPAAFIGLFAEQWIKENLFGSGQWGLWPTVAAWMVGGIAILAVAWNRKARGVTPGAGISLDQLTWRLALVIGLAQCVAMWPGTSRSLMTIVGGVLVGLTLPAAVEFSFLLGVVTLGAATAHDALKYGNVMLDHYGIVDILIGFFFAWLSAMLAVKWMVAYLNRHGLAVFGYYRVALGLAVALLLIGGIMDEPLPGDPPADPSTAVTAPAMAPPAGSPITAQVAP